MLFDELFDLLQAGIDDVQSEFQSFLESHGTFHRFLRPVSIKNLINTQTLKKLMEINVNVLTIWLLLRLFRRIWPIRQFLLLWLQWNLHRSTQRQPVSKLPWYWTLTTWRWLIEDPKSSTYSSEDCALCCKNIFFYFIIMKTIIFLVIYWY